MHGDTATAAATTATCPRRSTGSSYWRLCDRLASRACCLPTGSAGQWGVGLAVVGHPTAIACASLGRNPHLHRVVHVSGDGVVAVLQPCVDVRNVRCNFLGRHAAKGVVGVGHGRPARSPAAQRAQRPKIAAGRRSFVGFNLCPKTLPFPCLQPWAAHRPRWRSSTPPTQQQPQARQREARERPARARPPAPP